MAIFKDMNENKIGIKTKLIIMRLIWVLLRKVSCSNVNGFLRHACCCLYHIIEDISCSNVNRKLETCMLLLAPRNGRRFLLECQ